MNDRKACGWPHLWENLDAVPEWLRSLAKIGD
jgi:hypothetical protein